MSIAAIPQLETIGVSFIVSGVTLPVTNGNHGAPVGRRIISVENLIPKSSSKMTMHDAAYSVLTEEKKAIRLESLAATIGKKMGGRQIGPDSLRSVLSRTKDSTNKRIYAPMGEGKWSLAQWKSDGADLFTAPKKL